MKIRRALGLAGVAVLGAAVVVLPAAALSETTPGVVAENVGLYSHYWQPPSVKIEPGGTVEFSNPTEVAHGIRWFKTPSGAPACTSGIPVGTTEEASGKKWNGTCTFTTAGTYTYYCTVHGAAMSGTITVGTPPATTGTGTTTTPATTPTTGSTGPGGTTNPAGAALSALRLASTRHGTAVHGSLQVDSSAAGGTLTVVLSAKLGGHRVQVGRLTRAYISPGAQSWSIKLSARGRRALHAKGRLALTAKVSLTPPGGTSLSLTRSLVLHR